MTLYHGSNIEVKFPRLLQNQRELGFGLVFIQQAILNKQNAGQNEQLKE